MGVKSEDFCVGSPSAAGRRDERGINLLVVAIENWEDRWHTRCVCAAVGSSVE